MEQLVLYFGRICQYFHSFCFLFFGLMMLESPLLGCFTEHFSSQR